MLKFVSVSLLATLLMYIGGLRGWIIFIVYSLLLVLALFGSALFLFIRGSLITERKVAVMVGSDTDLKQCADGLDYLKLLHSTGCIRVYGVYTNSIHRNMFTVLFNLIMLWLMRVDAIIVVAGWAAHLPGMCEAFYRYVLRDVRIRIIPVAADADPTKPHDAKVIKRNLAAIYSISEVPKHQMILSNGKDVCFGSAGFLQACHMIIEIDDLEPVVLPEKKSAFKRTITEVPIIADSFRKDEKSKTILTLVK